MEEAEELSELLLVLSDLLEVSEALASVAFTEVSPSAFAVAPQGPFTMRTLRPFCRFQRSFVRGYPARFPFCALAYDPFRFCCGQDCGQYIPYINKEIIN